MAEVTGVRKSGDEYTPEFIDELNSEDCIGCGRCYKVCGESVFNLIERADLDMEDDDYEDEGAMVMVMENDGNCIGCKACSRVCPRNCHSFRPLAA